MCIIRKLKYTIIGFFENTNNIFRIYKKIISAYFNRDTFFHLVHLF